MLTHFCYIDPGIGSLFYQSLLSGIITISLFYNRIKTFIKSKMRKNKAQESDEIEPKPTNNV